jgi:hypothetical protein
MIETDPLVVRSGAASNDMASVVGGTHPGAAITIGPGLTLGYIAARHVVASAGR